MIDTLYQNLDRLVKPLFWDSYELREQRYFLLTLHRPSNVDEPEKLERILNSITEATHQYPIIFPIHPRTKQVLQKISFSNPQVHIVDPLGYLEFIYLVKNAKGIITDSGGITEEATVLGVPCLTLRTTTERPETVSMGTNELIGDDYKKLNYCLEKILGNEWKLGLIPPLWDGKTSGRIVNKLLDIYTKEKVKMYT